MRRDISELKQAVESTNAALRLAVEGLNATNAKLDNTNARLGNTNARLGKTNARLGNTNARLDKTNARLDKTNARLDSTNAELGTTNSKLNRTMIPVAGLVGEMAELKEYLTENMATKKDMSDLNSRMDGFSGLLLDSRHRWAVHAETLSAHDERIKKLETPTA